MGEKLFGQPNSPVARDIISVGKPVILAGIESDMMVGEGGKQFFSEAGQTVIVVSRPEMGLGIRVQVGVHAEPANGRQFRGCLKGLSFRLRMR